MLAAGLIVLAIASGNGGGDAGASQLQAARAASIERISDAAAVPDPNRRVLAEMTRRLGTPRRVSREARAHAIAYARIQAAARARARARAAARAARRAARSRLQMGSAASGYWVDSQANTLDHSRPDSVAETKWLQGGHGAWVEASGLARAPDNAPAAIKRVIEAGNRIARSPYIWGGGHGAWLDKGYDCSGSVSFALAAGGMLGYTQTSGQLMNWGAPGPGHWLTIYANGGHVFMYVAGLRFDTSGRAGDHASRWQLATRTAAGFVARHYPGL